MKPSFTYTVRNFENATGEATAAWRKIGAAFMHVRRAAARRAHRLGH
jgi:hypothetical protein